MMHVPADAVRSASLQTPCTKPRAMIRTLPLPAFSLLAASFAASAPEVAEGLAAEFYAAATELAATAAVPCPGVMSVLPALQARGIKQAVVSNSLRSFVAACLAKTEALPFFAVRDPSSAPRPPGAGGAQHPLELHAGVLGEDCVPAHKPDPRGLLIAMEGLRVAAPGRCVYVGDSTSDMTAAIAAGMRAVGVGWGNKTPAELTAAGAEVVLVEGDDILAALLSPTS